MQDRFVASASHARLFGPVDVQIEGQPIPRLRSRKSQLLLAILLIRSGSALSRDWLCETVWPDSFAAQGRLSLRQSLVDIRRALGVLGERLQTIGTSDLRLEADDLPIDVLVFDRIAARLDPTSEEIDHAVALHRGPLLEAHQLPFVEQARVHRLQQLSHLLIMRAERAELEEGAGTGVPYLRHAIRVNPLDERACRQLMENLAGRGEVAEALEAFRKLREGLLAQFDLEPAEETLEVYRAIREQVQSQHRRALAPSPARSTLPRQSGPLVGRELELASLETLVQNRPLVTVTGLGGVGKTRLAVEVAHRLAAQGEPIVFANVANIASPLELRDSLRAKFAVPSTWTLAEWLSERETILVLDECERVLSEVAELLTELIEAAPELHVLATCRVPLGLSSELIFPLAPLKVPKEDSSPSDLEAAPAVSLLLERLRRVNPQWAPPESAYPQLARIARRLEGLPLAIELAAAQSRVLSLSQLCDRLDRTLELLRSGDRDRPIRHRSVLRVLDDSYGLLPEEGKEALRLLAFYIDGFTLEAAEAMFGEDPLPRLTALVDACLVHRTAGPDGDSRYQMLDTIRDFALGLAGLEDRNLATERRYAFVLNLCQTANEGIVTSEQSLWIRRLELEMNTIRATLETARDNADFARVVAALIMFWHVTSRTEEPLSLLQAAVARREGVPPETLSRIEAGYGTIAWHRGDLWEAKRRFACAVELARGASEGYPEASALNGFSIVSRRLGHYEEAFEASERCVALMREHGSEPRVIRGQAVWARAATALGRYDQAEALLLDCLAGFERIGDDRERAHCLEGLAVNLMEQGRMTESKVRHREAIESLAKFDDAFRLAWSFASVANLLEREGRFREAAMLLGIVRELERTHRFEIVSVTSPRDRARLDQLEVHLGPEETARCFAEVSALSLNQAVVFALNLLAKAD